MLNNYKEYKMKKVDVILLRVMLVAVISSVAASQELSARDKIRIHKNWLERRNALKAQHAREISTLNTSTLINQKAEIKKDINENQRQKYIKNRNINKHLKIENNIDKTSYNDVFPEIEKSFTEVGANIESVTLPTESTTYPIETVSLPSMNMSSESIYNKNRKMSIVKSYTDRNSSTVQPHKFAVNNLRFYPRWTIWSSWSECSRSCGGGVMYQERKCMSNLKSGKRIIRHECNGLYRRYHLCNQQDCPSTDIDFRQKQCSSFDDELFKGKKYKWEPYIKEDSECELNCKPVGMKYFATLNQTVIDGTPCFRPAEYYRRNYRGRAICVDGICKALHASGIITGAFANSGVIPCGGLLCRSFSGIFTKNPLPEGYVHIAIIPAGSSNISITELKNSENLLGLKTVEHKSVINADHLLSASGPYAAAGTTFDYRRIDGLKNGNEMGVSEWITATGPTLEPIHLMVIGEDMNPGIKYEYLLPISSNYESEEDFLGSDSSIEDDEYLDSTNETRVSLKSADFSTDGLPKRRRRLISWKVVGFSPCSKSCGGGTQTPIIRCMRENPIKYVSPRRCTQSHKPNINDNLLRCNTQPCPAYWRADEWTECSCNEDQNYRQREIRCVQELAAGIIIQVNESACMEDSPIFRKKCECPKNSKRRKQYRRIHAHARAPEPLILTNVTHQANYRNENAGIWLTSDWNRHCSVECGTGIEHRSIFCDRTPPNTDRCDLRITPDSTRRCQNEKMCASGEWFTSSWSQCGGSCFNLTKSRQVICIRNGVIVDNEECKTFEKPLSTQNCSINDINYCKPRWHYAAWTQCSKSCGGGTQRRSVKCLELSSQQKTLNESEKCRYADREPIYRSCNTHQCPDAEADILQNDISPDCVDQFSNCDIIVKARLCSNNYYKINCCLSCREIQF